MKTKKFSNSFFIMLGLFSVIVGLGTGCGGSSSRSNTPESPPASPATEASGEPDDSGLPNPPPPRT